MPALTATPADARMDERTPLLASPIPSRRLPSSSQLLALSRALLNSSFLSPSSDSHDVPYLTNAPTLSKEGEKVRSAVREVVESLEELLRERNPMVEWDEARREWMGRAGEGGTGDGWQGFVWACRKITVDVDLPTTSLPTPSPAVIAAAHSSLLTLLQLPLTSPAFLSLLSDLVVLLRDLLLSALAKAEEEEFLSPEAGEAAKGVMEGVVDEVVGQEKAGSQGKAGTDGSPQELKDEFVERLQQILVQLQSTQAYRDAAQILLSLARSYVYQAVDDLTPSVDIETTSPRSTLRQPTNPVHLLVPLLEPFTGGPTSLSHLRTSFGTLVSRLSPSNRTTVPHALSQLFSQLDALIDRALLEPGWIISRNYYREVVRLQETASEIGRDDPVLGAAAGDFVSLLVDAVSNVASDTLLRRAATAIQHLGEAVAGWAEVAGGKALQVVEGQPLNAVWADLVEWVWPRLVAILAKTSLPRIEFASSAVSLAIEPPSLLSTSLIPSSISIRQTTDLTYNPSHGSSTLALPLSASNPAPPPSCLSPRTITTASSTRLEITGLRLELESVGYFASYHTGIPCFPTLTESGLLDLRLGSNLSGGLSLSLLTSTPASLAAQTLFELDHAETQVTLEDFTITPHHSSHPWLMWLLRPVLQAAVRKVVEKEVREKVVEAGVEWVGRVGWEVREKEREMRSEEEGEKLTMRGESGAQESVKHAIWRWIKAGWQVLISNGVDGSPSPPTPSSPASITAPALDNVHINTHGIALDLGSQEATVGLGSEGVVLPPGEAPIPHPDGHKKGLRRAIRDEVRSEVREGRRVRTRVMRLPGEVEQEREELVEYGQRERRGVTTWRSEVFNL